MIKNIIRMKKEEKKKMKFLQLNQPNPQTSCLNHDYTYTYLLPAEFSFNS